MTHAEFQEWRRNFVSHFPDTGEWLMDEKRAEMRRSWFDLLFSKLALRDVLAANLAIAGGTADHWDRFYPERIGVHVAKVAKRIAVDRADRLEMARAAKSFTKSRESTPSIVKDKSMAYALQQVKGMSRNDRRAWLNNYFGGGDYDYVNFPWPEATPEQKQRYAATRAGLRGDTVSEEQAANELRQKLAEITG